MNFKLFICKIKKTNRLSGFGNSTSTFSSVWQNNSSGWIKSNWTPAGVAYMKSLQYANRNNKYIQIKYYTIKFTIDLLELNRHSPAVSLKPTQFIKLSTQLRNQISGIILKTSNCHKTNIILNRLNIKIDILWTSFAYN